MVMHMYLNGQKIAEVFSLSSKGGRRWSFTCRPPILVADEDYEVYPPEGKPMRIMISSLVSDGVQSHIDAVEP